jgi:hypothetical protein
MSEGVVGQNRRAQKRKKPKRQYSLKGGKVVVE